MKALKTFAAIEAARSRTLFADLCPTEMTMISRFSIAWGEDRPPTVMEAMRMFEQISPSTVHRHLKKLRDKKLIELVEDAQDNRTKRITPTQRLLDAIEISTRKN